MELSNKIEMLFFDIWMATTPIIPGLVQDISIVLYEQMCGMDKYLMSMVSKEWNVFCMSKIQPIKPTMKCLEEVVKDCDILRILSEWWDSHEVMRLACRYGHVDLINILIKKGNDNVDTGLNEACTTGNMEIIHLLTTNEKRRADDWDYGLWGACEGCHLHIAKYMIDCYTKYPNESTIFGKKLDLHNAMYYAGLGGDMRIMQLLINNGGDSWDMGLSGACTNGHLSIVQYMIKMGAFRYNFELARVCRAGYFKIVKYLIAVGATHCSHCQKSMEEHFEFK